MGEQSRKKREAREQREQERQAKLRAMSTKIDTVRKKYAEDWSIHATTFATDGHYAWMADFVKGRPLILEVGTGDGAGTFALLAGGAVVVSIETDPQCLERAYENLKSAGMPHAREQRGSLTVNERGVAHFRYGKVTSAIPTQGVLLLGGDMLADAELKSWLLQQPRFDAVVCWNMGASLVENSAARDESHYRLSVQNKVYELADQVLKSGGVLHIVDRGRELLPGKEQDQLEDMIQAHREQAEVTKLQVNPNIAVRPYTPPVVGSGVTMIATNTTEYAYDPSKMAFWSIVSAKP